ncbi:MAG: amidohydrolase family protein [Candidatus Aminicenantes bacterium]|nr:amidohydrolase family protein [Candidatus Aminicenantes bacterium]
MMIKNLFRNRPLTCVFLFFGITFLAAACGSRITREAADVLILNGRVYTLTWGEPGLDGTPAPDAPRDGSGWHPDAEAVALRRDKILFVGSNHKAEKFRGAATRVIDLRGATVVPGLIETHTHFVELGQSLSVVDVRGIESEAEIVARIRAAAAELPAGQWVQGYGWDEGLWANRMPDMKLLSREVPDHPVLLRGLHGFCVWGNDLAFKRAGITAQTPSPPGGEIRKDKSGHPTGILVNSAVRLLQEAVPPPSAERLKYYIQAGLKALARAGYVAAHEAGVGSETMKALEALESEGMLPLRVYAMLAGRDEALMEDWLPRGPEKDVEGMLVACCVKAFYDAALGSRGARLLEDYSDLPGHKGVSGGEYGFNQDLMARMMKAGFQMSIHAIGDAGNRETLDFLESTIKAHPETRAMRHRVEHAQVLHPDDIPRFERMGIIASMQPPHAVEDKAWAEERLGQERVRSAYAWRSLRLSGARIAFNSDLPGSDFNFFYGLYAAVTRRDKEGQPEGGWHAEQCLSAEEALRAYTMWGAYAAFMEKRTGVLAPGRWADLTVMDIDPLQTSEKNPRKLLEGKILLTIVGGKIVYSESER